MTSSCPQTIAVVTVVVFVVVVVFVKHKAKKKFVCVCVCAHNPVLPHFIESLFACTIYEASNAERLFINRTNNIIEAPRCCIKED